MNSNFDRQVEPCAGAGLSVRPAPAANGKYSRAVPGAICDQTVSDRVLEHETEAAFLKELIAYEDNEANLRLRDDLAKAARESKCLRHAIFLMVTLFFLSLAGLSYCALLLPQIVSNPTHLVTRSLSFLGLASLISQLEFLGYLLWHRFTVNRLHKECRRRVLLLAESQLKPSLRRSRSADIGREPGHNTSGVPGDARAEAQS